MTNAIETKLNNMGITLPESIPPAASYVPYSITGNLVVISGQLPMRDGKAQYIGKVGREFSVEEGQDCARICGENILAHVKAACDGDLSRVTKCVRLGIFVNTTSEATDQPVVANGISDMFVEIFGKEVGAHARAAVGVGSLPFGVAVEVEAMFEIA